MKILTLIMSLLTLNAMAANELQEVESFGDNPGRLRMYTYITSQNANKLVVVLHGCNQQARSFDDETGWLQVADEKNLNLLFVEQPSSNNNFSCFNWFEPGDNTRGRGELASIHNMVQYMINTTSAKDVYITGLSAGGIMANSMLASYPGLFKGGAIAAGVYHGCANNSFDAFACMYGYRPEPSARELGRYVERAADGYAGKWPKVVIVQGTSDSVVAPKNARLLLAQWAQVHQIDTKSDSVKTEGKRIEVNFYRNAKGSNKVMTVSIERMDHGYPIDEASGCGISDKYILNVGYCLASKSLELLDL